MVRHQRLRHVSHSLRACTRVDKETSFSQMLFDNPISRFIREAVKKTRFFRGMVSGDLDPEDHGGYVVQDVAYCFEAVKAFDIAAPKMEEEGKADFALLYRAKSERYKRYNEECVKNWKLENVSSVVLGPAAQMYVAYESALGEKDPEHLCIGILPCNMLWHWLAKELNPFVPDSGLYKQWFKENLSDHPSSTEKFVDKFFSLDNLEECLPIFNKGMINELNFFLSACGENLVDYDFSEAILTEQSLL